MNKYPCIKIKSIEDWKYIREKLENIGYIYEECNINYTIIDNCLLVLNCGNVFGKISNFFANIGFARNYNRYLVNDKNEFINIAAKLFKNNMEKRNIQIDLETAKKLYNGNDKSLKELALQAYNECELVNINYKDICKNMFLGKTSYYINSFGEITVYDPTDYSFNNVNNCFSKKQCEKLIAINKLMNVAKYLNEKENKRKDGIVYYIKKQYGKLVIDWTNPKDLDSGAIYFNSMQLAKQAIEILGEDIIRLALSTDY